MRGLNLLPNERPFRFGVTLHLPSTRREWMDKCRKAEDLGYDTILIPDHLGMPAPFPALMLAAEVTERPRLGTAMINAGFYPPLLLAREVATMDLFTDGRLELGIGTGQAKHEFEAAGLPFPPGGARVDHLERTVAELRRVFAAPETRPLPAQRPMPPLVIAGRGDRVLKLAAQEADIVGFNGAASSRFERPGLPTFGGAADMAERVAYVRGVIGERVHEVEFTAMAPAVVPTPDPRAALERLGHLAPQLSVAERAEVPGFLVGTAEQMADKVRANRELYGISYVCVMEQSIDAMAPVMERVRGGAVC
ncbi:TIGR03621 family F420-dependent LLM class oxidoreductase [Nonomuraea rhizosphaerae]|uniref:TIGR03621 family F420-dependent LLM class oxidoreductase n=1 Tax=Nonomuraea rhizosphaerae TaxID=2665663 RepID=UPI001C5F311A|nr:TIGR03621 family F420-dependent LLM class oxidoreductase [Nonomuraea rhizosphaerae]